MDSVRIVEVGPRDGLQNEPRALPAELKIRLIERLADCGLRSIEAGSFVSPRRVPQMADSDAVLSALRPRRGVRYPVLVPNAQGFRRALAAGAREVAVFTAASDAFTRRNTQCSLRESLARSRDVADRARDAGLPVRGYVSTVMGCPYQGPVKPGAVVRLVRAMADMGCYEVSLGDTIGAGTPRQARAVFRACAEAVGAKTLALHFHDTRGQALANVYACMEEGARVIDASVAGLGGCPYANGASGNLATEDLVYMLHGMGVRTGVDADALIDTARWISAELKREPASRLARAGRFSPAAAREHA